MLQCFLILLVSRRSCAHGKRLLFWRDDLVCIFNKRAIPVRADGLFLVPSAPIAHLVDGSYHSKMVLRGSGVFSNYRFCLRHIGNFNHADWRAKYNYSKLLRDGTLAAHPLEDRMPTDAPSLGVVRSAFKSRLKTALLHQGVPELGIRARLCCLPAVAFRHEMPPSSGLGLLDRHNICTYGIRGRPASASTYFPKYTGAREYSALP